ncbi:MAG TPA: hypothetical protein VHK65_02150 [Candidatus Dormibacteraeota bacterium]|nr:hypothetical protein [Candidatus Dormibacteraeota bacterium]
MPAEEYFDEFRELVGEITEKRRNLRAGQSWAEGSSERWRALAQLGFEIDENLPEGLAVQNPILSLPLIKRAMSK